MDPEIAAQLLDLNQRFYESFGQSFSATRQRIQPGVRRVLGLISPHARVLDLGCGNGFAAQVLNQNQFAGIYDGIDSSAPLLQEADHTAANVHFFQADLASADWEACLPTEKYDPILSFAVIHHLPGIDLRRAFLLRLRALLEPGGIFIHSHWQFLNSQRLRERIQPWEMIGLTSEQVEAGDYLLDWRRDGYGLRYVHLSTEDELRTLASETGFNIKDSFLSDGEGNKLGLYQIWQYRL